MTSPTSAARRQILDVRTLTSDELTDLQVDGSIFVVGYEPRARHAAEVLRLDASHKHAMVYTDQAEHDFSKNLKALQALEFKCEPVGQEDFDGWFADVLESVIHTSAWRDSLRLAIDISSLDRYRLSRVIWHLGTLRGAFSITASFLYSPAKFDRSRAIPTIPTTSMGAVSPPFAGWARNPEDPCSILLGLGLERDQAFTAVELLEPSLVWTFIASDGAKGFQDQVLKRNEDLLSQIGPPAPSPYQLHDLASLEGELRHLIARSREARSVVVPLGPKAFALAGLIAAYREFPAAAVWRISAGKGSFAYPTKAEGPVVGLEVTFDAPSDVAEAQATR